MRNRRRGLRLRPLVDQLDDRCLLSNLTPALLTGAYGLSGLTFTTSSGATVKADGSGETIALVEGNGFIRRDFPAFDHLISLKFNFST